MDYGRGSLRCWAVADDGYTHALFGTRETADDVARRWSTSQFAHGCRYEARPYPAPATCADCKAVVCDCRDPKAGWGYWWRGCSDYENTFCNALCLRDSASVSSLRLQTFCSRTEATGSLAADRKHFPDVSFGPVQRRTDPPWKFESPSRYDAASDPVAMAHGARAARENMLQEVRDCQCERTPCVCGAVKAPPVSTPMRNTPPISAFNDATLARLQREYEAAHSMMVLEVDKDGSQRIYPASTCIDVRALALALFATDPRVIDIIARKDDGIVAIAVWAAGEKGHSPEAGWVAEAVKRAADVAAKMGGE
jgi:hypothetical protein